jgi:hypothetical protein
MIGLQGILHVIMLDGILTSRRIALVFTGTTSACSAAEGCDIALHYAAHQCRLLRSTYLSGAAVLYL